MRRRRSLNALHNRSRLRDLAAQRLANASNLTELASAQRALDVASEAPTRVLSSDADIAAYVRDTFPPKAR